MLQGVMVRAPRGCPIWLLMATACSGSVDGSAPGDVRVVGFRQNSIVITHLESPTAPPYAVGSAPSRELLRSSNPSIVDIDWAGNLIGHRNGEVEIRAPGGATLHVLVRAARVLNVEPKQISISMGGQGALRLFADGSALPAEAITWQTSNPSVAVAFGAIVHAGPVAGTATLTAIAGDARASVEVRVEPPVPTLFVVSPSEAKLTVGSVHRLSVDAGALAGVAWTSSNEAILQPLRDGLFYAKAPGRCQACAAVGERKSCALVAVSR